MKTVLLIDDARCVRSLYSELIRQAGFVAETAASTRIPRVRLVTQTR